MIVMRDASRVCYALFPVGADNRCSSGLTRVCIVLLIFFHSGDFVVCCYVREK